MYHSLEWTVPSLSSLSDSSETGAYHPPTAIPIRVRAKKTRSKSFIHNSIQFDFISKQTGYRCSKCFTTLKTTFTAKVHTLSHTGERPHTCDDCGKTFSHRSTLVNHKKTHEHPEFQCKTCHKWFTRKANMKRHMRLVHKFSVQFIEGVMPKSKSGRKRKKKDEEAESDLQRAKRRQAEACWLTPQPICSPVDDYEDSEWTPDSTQISFAQCAPVNTVHRTTELKPSSRQVLARSLPKQNVDAYQRVEFAPEPDDGMIKMIDFVDCSLPLGGLPPPINFMRSPNPRCPDTYHETPVATPYCNSRLYPVEKNLPPTGEVEL